MKARAVLVADGARLTTLHGEPPLLLRRTGTADDGATVVHLVGGAAGPLAGDDLDLRIELTGDAAVEVRSVAATVALPGRTRDWSTLTVTVRVGPGATLRWLPEPLIAAAGCRHVSRARVELAAGARLMWRDELVCGRHGEQPGDLRSELHVRYAGRPLLAHDLAVGPEAPGWAGPAVLGRARAAGSLLTVNLPHPENAMPLNGPGALTVAVGEDLSTVSGSLVRGR
ncbi:urease accessory protein UreD [Virgisporangium ochraceum]|uniref:Urease accessory protein UreD n=1 Tax=Virgisporangium ochraceum TaxID=65505 RepID=A0A8J4EH12_9ACTN|nr:urease accessory protein UreD [Virgisporangium ochraceum]GIJ74233.1 urease accessory protein UreD [Virgisporangium ochraceum]